jgi:hypothetical protein
MPVASQKVAETPSATRSADLTTSPTTSVPAAGTSLQAGMAELGVRGATKIGDLLEIPEHVRRTFPRYEPLDERRPGGKRGRVAPVTGPPKGPGEPRARRRARP